MVLPLIDMSIVDSTEFKINGLNLSTTSLLEQLTRKEYGQAKKSNNHFNIPLGTKLYRLRVKPWKPITLSFNRFISIFYLSNHSVLFV